MEYRTDADSLTWWRRQLGGRSDSQSQHHSDGIFHQESPSAVLKCREAPPAAQLQIDRRKLVRFDPVRPGLPIRRHVRQMDWKYGNAPSEAWPLCRGYRADDDRAEIRLIQRVDRNDEAWTDSALLTALAGVEIDLPELPPTGLHPLPGARDHSTPPRVRAHELTTLVAILRGEIASGGIEHLEEVDVVLGLAALFDELSNEACNAAPTAGALLKPVK
jgi:hypothetical protein